LLDLKEGSKVGDILGSNDGSDDEIYTLLDWIE
jgi:hypothetical protein